MAKLVEVKLAQPGCLVYRNGNDEYAFPCHVSEHFQRAGKTVKFFERATESFIFHPELFEQRGIASELPENTGFAWMSDYSSIDLLHEEYGLEVCAIRNEQKASAIGRVMVDGFPQWHYRWIDHKDYGREAGWKFSIHMFRRKCGGGRWVDSE